MGNPYVSVVICTMGQPTRVLECLKKQTFTDFEVIIASEKGIVNAMNCALKKAKGEIFVRIDDDVEMPPAWLEELIKPFSDLSVAGVTGPTFVPLERRKYRDSIRFAENPGRFIRWLYDNTFLPGGIRKCGCVSYDSNFEEKFKTFNSLYHKLEGSVFEPDHLEGTNWAMRTDLIRRVGGFDPAFDGVAEWYDTDVEQKVKKLPCIFVFIKPESALIKANFEGGYKLIYNPKAYLYHLLEKGEHYNDRFDGFGRIKNWLRYHKRHSKFHWKMVIFLLVWAGYFIWKKIKR